MSKRNANILLGLAGLLALSQKPSGSASIKQIKSKDSTKTWTPLGFSWNSDTPLFHATVGYSKIEKSGRLKLRSQLIAQNQTNISGAGGALRGYLSTTTDSERALAIAIGVNVLRKAAQGEYNYIEFDKKLGSICPDYNRHKESLQTYEEVKNEYDWIKNDLSYTPEKHNFNQCAQMYRDFLSYSNAFNPFFSNPEYNSYIHINKQDIGVITGFSDIPRLCMTSYDAYQMGLISERKPSYKWLDKKGIPYKIKRALNKIWESDLYKSKEEHYFAWDKSSWGARGLVEDLKHAIGDYIGDYKIEWIDKQEITLDSVMTMYIHEYEVEIWSPSRYKIDWKKSNRLIDMPHFQDLYLPEKAR